MVHTCAIQVVGLGVLGKEGSGQLRMVAKQQKIKMAAKKQKGKSGTASAYGGGSGIQTSGLTTSLAFTPVQVGFVTFARIMSRYALKYMYGVCSMIQHGISLSVCSLRHGSYE